MDRDPRRSSILKPQKHRSPLAVLETENPDTSLVNKSRRVSFASSNYVKQFAADPDKNTIWDNTYEEEIHHDSTQSSQEPSVMASKTTLSHLSTTTNVEQEVEITTIVTKAQKERRKTINFNVDGGEDMVIDENYVGIPASIEISGRISVDPQFVHLEQCRNKTLMCNEDVDFTGVLPIVDKENIIPPPQVLNPLIVSNLNTGASSAPICERKEGIINFIKRTRSMNIVESNISSCQQVDVSTSVGHYKENEQNQNAPEPAFAPLDTTVPPFVTLNDASTDIQNKSTIEAIKRKKDDVYSPNPLMIPKKMCFNTTVNDMSMTKQLPTNILVTEHTQNTQHDPTVLNYTNFTRDTSMQFTQQLPTNIHENLMFNNYTTQNFNISMESTKQLPIKLITNAGSHKHNYHRHLDFDEKSEIAGEMTMDLTKINPDIKQIEEQIPNSQEFVDEKSAMELTGETSLKLMEELNVQHFTEQVPKNQVLGNEKPALNIKEKISDKQISKTARTANVLYSVEKICNSQESVIGEKSAMDITCKSSKFVEVISNKQTEQRTNSNQEFVDEKSAMELTHETSSKLMEKSNVQHFIEQVSKHQVFVNDNLALNIKEKISDKQISETTRTPNILQSVEQISNNQESVNEKSAMDITCKSSKLTEEISNKRTEQITNSNFQRFIEQIPNNQEFVHEKSAMDITGKYSNLAEEMSSKRTTKITKPDSQKFVSEKSTVNVTVKSSPKTNMHITKTAENYIPTCKRTVGGNSAMDTTLTQDQLIKQNAEATVREEKTFISDTHVGKKDVLSLESADGNNKEETANIEVFENNFTSKPEINVNVCSPHCSAEINPIKNPLSFEVDISINRADVNLSKATCSNQSLRNPASVKDSVFIEAQDSSNLAQVKSPKHPSYVDEKMECESGSTMTENDVRNNEHNANTVVQGNSTEAANREPFENTNFPSYKLIPPTITVNEPECSDYLQNLKSDMCLIEPKKIVDESKESFFKADSSKRNIFTEVPNTDETINAIQRYNPHMRTFNADPSFSLNFNSKQNEQTVCQISFNADNHSPRSAAKPSSNESKVTRELTLNSPHVSFAVGMPDAESFALSLDVTNENYNIRIESPKSRATFSPCTDDTQHLINYRLSGRKESQTEYSKIIAGDYKPYVNSKIAALSDSIPQFVEQCYEDDLCNATSKKDDSTSKMDLSLVNDDKLDSFANVTMGAEKCVIEIRKGTAYEDSVVEDKLQDELDVNKFLKEIRESLTKFSLPERNNHHFNQLIEEFDQLDCRLDNVVKQIDPEQLEADFSNLSSQFSIEPDTADNSKDSNNTETPFFSQYDISEEENTKSIMGKIEEKAKRSKWFWTITPIEGGRYQIASYYGAVLINVMFNENGVVTSLETATKIKDNARPISKYVVHLFETQLSANVIPSFLGDNYDILSLLDYVHMTMQKTYDILQEYDDLGKQYSFEMDDNSKVSFKILDWKLCIAWLITVDFSNSVVTEDHISIEGLRCVAPQQVIKRCSNNCPAGFPFFRSFIDNIKAYIASRKK